MQILLIPELVNVLLRGYSFLSSAFLKALFQHKIRQLLKLNECYFMVHSSRFCIPHDDNT